MVANPNLIAISKESAYAVGNIPDVLQLKETPPSNNKPVLLASSSSYLTNNVKSESALALASTNVVLGNHLFGIDIETINYKVLKFLFRQLIPAYRQHTTQTKLDCITPSIPSQHHRQLSTT